MKNRTIYSILGTALLVSALAACDQFDAAREAQEIAPMKVTVVPELNIQGLPSPDELKIRFQNFSENIDITVTAPAGQESVTAEGIIPGLYTVTVSGKVTTADGDYYLSGNEVNFPIVSSEAALKIPVRALVAGKLLFQEFYFCGCKTDKNAYYFRDQFQTIYNNTASETYYLDDNIYWAQIEPMNATTNLPVWPEEDGGNFAYGSHVWKFPGSGRDLPLKPGEAVILSQIGINNQMSAFNPLSPVDNSGAEFEFYVGNASYGDNAAKNMECVFCDGKNVYNNKLQVLLAVFGPAVVVFRVPDGVKYDPINDPQYWTCKVGVASPTRYARIPIDWVLDALECGQNENMMAAKRVPSVLDAGMTYVGGTYMGVSVSRKKIGTHADGSPVLQDTNNSNDDFDRGLVPLHRRYGSKVPSWNTWINND